MEVVGVVQVAAGAALLQLLLHQGVTGATGRSTTPLLLRQGLGAGVNMVRHSRAVLV
jgi:hypothetical protein